jgi:hypothetical protein
MSVPPIGPLAAGLRVEAAATAEEVLAAAVNAAMSPETATPPVASTPPPGPIAPAVDAARAAAAGRQGSLAPLFANLAQALASPDLPAPLRVAIGQVLALQTPLSAPLTAQTILQLVAQSGLFLEAHLAQAALAGGPALTAEGPPPDLKAALLTLQAALAAQPSAKALPPPAATVPPPHRDAALTAQPAAPATLPAGAEVPVVVQHLRAEVAQAVARQTLHQLASTPDGAAAAWLFELPLATPQGTAIAQFEIRRDDGRRPDGAEPSAGWRVRFSIDIEPLGPVHVHLRAAGDSAQVTIWAERDGSLDHLRSQGGVLARALPAEVVFRAGAPRRPPPPSGQFVDQSS